MSGPGKLIVAIAVLTFALAGTALAQTPDAQWKPVQDAMGRPGKMQPDGTFKFAMPRKDLHVTVNGTPVQAGLALGSWAAFAGSPSNAMVMGDLVLTQGEVEPVMLKLQQEGVQQTALHNHLLNENPRIMYMHIMGKGNAVQLAKAIHDAVALTATPAPQPASPAAAGSQSQQLDAAQIGSILGHKAAVNGGIVQVSVPRAEKIMDMGMEVPPSMGTATSFNFQPVGNGRAAITGDFVLLASEVNPVLKTLRENGIAVTALHSHMLDEQPQVFFMHFWAVDNAVKLAKGLRAALDKTNSAH